MDDQQVRVRHDTLKPPHPLPGFVLVAVPNVSVGDDPVVVGRLAASVRRAEDAGARLLDVHSDADHNRTVLTMAGAARPLSALVAACCRGAIRLATIEGHVGVHPRIGLLDVVPFVPYGATPMAEAVAAARRTSQALGDGFGVPVFHYGELAQGPRARLVTYRRAGDRLAQALASDLPPDEGPGRPHPRAGAACVGARPPMIAYNVLASGDEGAARRIAHALRAANGGPAGVEAHLFRLPRRGCLQFSFNLRDPAKAPPAVLYEALRRSVSEQRVELGPAEVVGLSPAAFLPPRPRDAGLLRLPASLETMVAAAGLTPG